MQKCQLLRRRKNVFPVFSYSKTMDLRFYAFFSLLVSSVFWGQNILILIKVLIIDPTYSLKSKVCDFLCLTFSLFILGILERYDNFLLRITFLTYFQQVFFLPFCLGLILVKELYAYIPIPLNFIRCPSSTKRRSIT